MWNHIPFSPRLTLLWEQSYLEEGVNVADIPDPRIRPRIALYPRSFVEAVERLGPEKSIDFNFRGSVYEKSRRPNRQWVLQFAKRHFTDRSHFLATDRPARQLTWRLCRRHRILGSFDYTFRSTGFVPKETVTLPRSHFDQDYFRIMRASEFTLCPAGDAPWSMRFHEAIMAGSIPILENAQHAGRNALEYAIGYRYYLMQDEPFVFRSAWTQENFQKFLRFQTLMLASPCGDSH